MDSLLSRWRGGSQQPSQAPESLRNQGASSKAVEISPADAKRFGLENFGNTCYANSVIQALYFCPPFRELVSSSPDRSSLYPTPLPASLITPAPQPHATAPKQTTKDPKSSSGHKRPASGHHAPNGDARVDGSNTDAENTPNTGPPLPNSPPTLFSAFRSLFVHISQHSHDKGMVSPTAFITKLKKENELFRSTQHQDAHEFLNYLLNKIVEDIGDEEKLLAKQPPIAPANEDLSTSITTIGSTQTASLAVGSSKDHERKTFVHELFEGTLTSETRCLTCETVSSRDEMFLDLSIDIEQNSSVTACLRQFSASEMLCQRNKFFCDSCCGLQEAEKRMKIKRLPNVLALHLKRFKYQEDLQKYIKLSYRVAFPFELRLFNTVDDAINPDRLYELFAIVVHIGAGPTHGHYITITKAQGTWYVFDDTNVDTIKESEIPKYFGDSGSGTGYVLFYQAVDVEREALGLQPLKPEHSVELPSAAEKAEPSSPVVPITIEPGSPSPVLPVAKNEISLASPPPSPTAPHPKPPIKLEPPNGTLSPATAESQSPSISIAASSVGFLSSLRHSKSLKNRISLGATGLVPPLPKLNGEVNGSTEKEVSPPGTKDEKHSSNWLGLRSKDKRKDSVSQPEQPPAAPSSPNIQTSATAPPSPRVSTTRRPSTSGTGILEQISPLPSASLPLPSPSKAIADPTKSILDPPPIDGSDSLSGSSSWTSGVDPKDIPPVPKDLPPVPPLPVLSTSLPKTLTSSPAPSTLSVPTTSGGDATRPDSPGQSTVDTKGQTKPPSIAGSSTGFSMATSSGISQPLTPVRTSKASIKDIKDAVKAKKAAEAVAKKERERQEEEKKRAEKIEFEEKRKKEKAERDRLEKERADKEKAEKENRRLSKPGRKMSLGIGISSLWSRDKDKEKEKEKERLQASSLPTALRTGTATSTSISTNTGTSAGTSEGVHQEPKSPVAKSPKITMHETQFVPTINI